MPKIRRFDNRRTDECRRNDIMLIGIRRCDIRQNNNRRSLTFGERLSNVQHPPAIHYGQRHIACSISISSVLHALATIKIVPISLSPLYPCLTIDLHVRICRTSRTLPYTHLHHDTLVLTTSNKIRAYLQCTSTKTETETDNRGIWNNRNRVDKNNRKK